MHTGIDRREIFIRFALVLVCLGFWRSELNYLSLPLLTVAWLIDGGLYRLKQSVSQPLTQAILLLCALLLLGLFWSDLPQEGRMKWLKYFVLLFFIPFHALLNRERLPWVIGALLISYSSVCAMGVYHWLNHGGQGIPWLNMSYLSFSAMLGVGIVTAISLACMSSITKWTVLLWLSALVLLGIQFHQSGRILLLATLITLMFLIFLRYKIEFKKFIGIFVLIAITAAAFAYNSPVFQNRWLQVMSDIELLQQGNYSSSLGYRLAMWDVGLHGILDSPLVGYGTGTPERYFDQTIQTYKNGLYQDLPQFVTTSHYHNDWIEIGMHLGILGIFALLFLFWGWYRTLHQNQLDLLAAGLLSYVFLAGLTDTFLIFSRTPLLLLIITAIAVTWQKERS